MQNIASLSLQVHQLQAMVIFSECRAKVLDKSQLIVNVLLYNIELAIAFGLLLYSVFVTLPTDPPFLDLFGQSLLNALGNHVKI